MTDRPVDLGRAPAVGGGELVLRRREGAGPHGGDVLELVVDGVFAMDTVDVSTELELAGQTLRRLGGRDWRVVVGGLGLGYTLRELLADRRVASVQVVELEPALVQWVRDGLVPPAAGVLDDPRVDVVLADVADYLHGLPPASVDAVLLDVDNGPEFLVHGSNAALYEARSLSRTLGVLRPGGVLAVWCAGRSPALADALAAAAGSVEEIPLTVRRESRVLAYALYLARP